MSEEQGMYGVPGLIPWTVRDQHAVVLIQEIAELRAVLQAVLDHEAWFRTAWSNAFPDEMACHAVVSENIPREAALRERIRAALGVEGE